MPVSFLHGANGSFEISNLDKKILESESTLEGGDGSAPARAMSAAKLQIRTACRIRPGRN
jgi:hypothetical protein